LVGASCTSLAVVIAVVAIIAIVVIVATIRATLIALSVLTKLTRKLHVCLQPCLPDIAAIVVAATPAIVVGVRLVTRHGGATRGRRDQLFPSCQCLSHHALGFFLTMSLLDNLCTRGASHACPLPRGCLLLIVAFYVSTLATTVATIMIIAIVVVLVCALS
jgi:hypothetical protein